MQKSGVTMLILKKKSIKRDEGLFILIKKQVIKTFPKEHVSMKLRIFQICETKTEKTTKINCQN